MIKKSRNLKQELVPTYIILTQILSFTKYKHIDNIDDIDNVLLQ